MVSRILSCVLCGWSWFSIFFLETRAVEPATLSVWPAAAPGETGELPAEVDTMKPTDRLVGGKTVSKLTNVSHPTLTIYQPPEDRRTGTAVIICPGGGHRILAMDLEGTEVAEWLTSIGVTACLLKYRVPAREGGPRWKAAVQDAQRSVSLVRRHATSYGLDPHKIGILGFSAGGETAGLTAILRERQYDAVDDTDQTAFRPDFAILVYPAGFVERGAAQLAEHVHITSATPPMFLVHAFDDGVSPLNSLALATACKQAHVPVELHLFATGGHGFGLRPTDEPCTRWPELCERWMRRMGHMHERP